MLVRIDPLLALGAEVTVETVLTAAGVAAGVKEAMVATGAAVDRNSANPDAWLVDR